MHSSNNSNTTSFRAGLQAAIPIAVGYIPIAITFGLLAKSTGLPDSIGLLMSIIIFAGASQFVGVSLLALATNPWEIVLTTFILNLRHLLMSASLSQRLDSQASTKYLPLIAFGVTDETFTIASLREEAVLSPHFLLGLHLLAFLSWVTGTWAGIFLANGLPVSLKSSMGIALYAMFIGLLIPATRASKRVLLVVLAAVFFHSLLTWIPILSLLSAGWKIILATVITALSAAILFPAEVKHS